NYIQIEDYEWYKVEQSGIQKGKQKECHALAKSYKGQWSELLKGSSFWTKSEKDNGCIPVESMGPYTTWDLTLPRGHRQALSVFSLTFDWKQPHLLGLHIGLPGVFIMDIDELVAKDCDGEKPRRGKAKKVPRGFDFSKHGKRHVAFWIKYLGWDFQGFVVQDDTEQTIEAALFQAFAKTKLVESRQTSNYHRCGRTDKGVSAFTQVISLDVRSNAKDGVGVITPNPSMSSGSEELNYSYMLNRVLPHEIRVIAWAPVESSFSARFNCVQRTYKYFIPRGNLNIEEAALSLIGEHDFRNLCKMDVNNGVLTYTRKISSVTLDLTKGTEDSDQQSPYDLFVLTIEGQGFLWHQIRCIVAILLLIGEGKEDSSVIQELLDISKNPWLKLFLFSKPVYAMAHELSLCLFDAQFDGLEWQFDELALKTVILELQEAWARHAIKAEMIRSMLGHLEPQLPKSAKGQALWLQTGVLPRNYTPLLQRQKCESLETRIACVNERKKRKLQENECLQTTPCENSMRRRDELRNSPHSQRACLSPARRPQPTLTKRGTMGPGCWIRSLGSPRHVDLSFAQDTRLFECHLDIVMTHPKPTRKFLTKLQKLGVFTEEERLADVEIGWWNGNARIGGFLDWFSTHVKPDHIVPPDVAREFELLQEEGNVLEKEELEIALQEYEDLDEDEEDDSAKLELIRNSLMEQITSLNASQKKLMHQRQILIQEEEALRLKREVLLRRKSEREKEDDKKKRDVRWVSELIEREIKDSCRILGETKALVSSFGQHDSRRKSFKVSGIFSAHLASYEEKEKRLLVSLNTYAAQNRFSMLSTYEEKGKVPDIAMLTLNSEASTSTSFKEGDRLKQFNFIRTAWLCNKRKEIKLFAERGAALMQLSVARQLLQQVQLGALPSDPQILQEQISCFKKELLNIEVANADLWEKAEALLRECENVYPMSVICGDYLSEEQKGRRQLEVLLPLRALLLAACARHLWLCLLLKGEYFALQDLHEKVSSTLEHFEALSKIVDYKKESSGRQRASKSVDEDPLLYALNRILSELDGSTLGASLPRVLCGIQELRASLERIQDENRGSISRLFLHLQARCKEGRQAERAWKETQKVPNRPRSASSSADEATAVLAEALKKVELLEAKQVAVEAAERRSEGVWEELNRKIWIWFHSDPERLKQELEFLEKQLRLEEQLWSK
ncbi:unnamed protein product, partial [Darwinula stevensoni]